MSTRPTSSLDGVMNSWERDKVVLVFKMSTLVACNLSSIIYVKITEPHLGSEYFSIILPAIIFGYLVINTTEIIVMHLNQAHTFIEMWTAGIGGFGSVLCCVYQCYKWIGAWIDNVQEGTGVFPAYDCFLSVTLLIMSISLFVVSTVRIKERRADVEGL